MGPRIGFIGAGRVATVLAEALDTAGYHVSAVASRTGASAQRLGARLEGRAIVTAGPQAVADSCDLVFIATPDDVIERVAETVRWRPGQRVAHCSGALSVDVLATVTRAGGYAGGFHPLQTFAGGATGLRGVTIALEGGEPPLSELKEMAEAVGGQWIAVPSEGKALYHASGVLVSNYVVTLVEQATRLLESLGVGRDQARRALLTLLEGTKGNIETLGIPASLTGPIARGDVGTVERHMVELEKGSPALAEAYRALGRLTVPIAKAKGTLTPTMAERLESLLDHDKPARRGGRVLAPQEV